VKSPQRFQLSLIAAACLLFALASQSANIPISSLPFAITGPGTYVVTGNLTCSIPTITFAAAITVPTSLSGPVVIDLSGFTLTGSGVVGPDGASAITTGIGIGWFANSSVSNTYPITIRNGTIRNFGTCVWAEVDGVGGISVNLTDLTINNVTFTVDPPRGGNSEGIHFRDVSSSTVSNCIFNNGIGGIADFGSKGGNTYNNDIFNTGGLVINGAFNSGDPGSFILDHCHSTRHRRNNPPRGPGGLAGI
jgi:hypothetical protein